MVSGEQIMKRLFNHVKRLHSSGSQEPGNGFKQLKFHHLKDRKIGALTQKQERIVRDAGK